VNELRFSQVLADKTEKTTSKYDVAISFLSRDEALASGLFDLLEGLNVFFFPRKQEELAGTNGLESMREPFLTARVVVVLYRVPWGDTNWTRVEQGAITERLLKEGWDWLLFVQVDRENALPKWLPPTHVRFGLEQYGVEQLAGAVKARVQQQGGTIERPNALSHAKRVQREAHLLADQMAFFHDRRWIEQNVYPQIEALMKRVVLLTEQFRTELGMGFVAHVEGRRCVVRDDRVSLNIGWKQSIFNSAVDDAELVAAEFNGPLFVAAERMMTVFSPSEIRRHRFTLTLSLSRELRWNEIGKKGEPLSTEDLADRLMSLFLDLLNRADKGQIDLMHV
jgi:hypothetical protein